MSKEVEKPKYLPTEVVGKAREAGFASFNISQHTSLWKDAGAKRAGKGYGCDVSGQWYWYDSWVRYVMDYLAKNSPESHVTQ